MASIGAIGCFFLLAGCGDAVPPAAQGGVSVFLEQYDDMDPVYGKRDCPPYRHWLNIPYDHDHTPGSQRQLTDKVSAIKAVNNQDGDSVSCSVKPSGSGFVVKGDATAYAESAGTKYRPSIVHIRITQIAPGDTNSKGMLTVQDEQSLNPYTSDLCTFSVQGDSLGVAAGRIWGSLRCEGLTDTSIPDSACLVDMGFFLFENCAQ